MYNSLFISTTTAIILCTHNLLHSESPALKRYLHVIYTHSAHTKINKRKICKFWFALKEKWNKQCIEECRLKYICKPWMIIIDLKRILLNFFFFWIMKMMMKNQRGGWRKSEKLTEIILNKQIVTTTSVRAFSSHVNRVNTFYQAKKYEGGRDSKTCCPHRRTFAAYLYMEWKWQTNWAR